jgi:hypothetical protein
LHAPDRNDQLEARAVRVQRHVDEIAPVSLGIRACDREAESGAEKAQKLGRSRRWYQCRSETKPRRANAAVLTYPRMSLSASGLTFCPAQPKL